MDDAVPRGASPDSAVAPVAARPAPVRALRAAMARWGALSPSIQTLLPWLLAFALALSVPFVDTDAGDLDAFANAGTYVLLALGLNVVVGFAGLLDLGYAAFFALGAYTYGLAASFQLKPGWSALWVPFQWLGQVDQVQFGGASVVRLHFSYWLVLPMAAALCALWGILFGAPTLRLKGDYLAIVTLGFGEIVPIVLRNMPTVTNGAQGLPGVQTPSIFSYNFGFNVRPYYYLIVALAALTVAVSYRLQYSRTGRAWLALREDELAAATMGINHVHYKLLAFAIGAAIAGIAGTFYVAKLTTATPDSFSFTISTMVLVMIVLGGTGSIPGALAGAIVLTIFQSSVLGQLNVWAHNLGNAHDVEWLASLDLTQLNQLIFGLVLVIMMLYRRQGLIPARRSVGALLPGDQVIEAQRGGFKPGFRLVEQNEAPPSGQPLLEIHALCKRFGGVTAADGIDLVVYPGEIVSVIGPNGSGKTTLFNLITGLYKPDAGYIRFLGQDVTALPPHRIAEVGIARTFQNIRLFNNLSLIENVLIGQHHRLHATVVEAVMRTPRVHREEEEAMQWATQVLALFGNRLLPRLGHVVSSLSYANRRRAEIARALVARPRLLLLDEPTAGMNPAETLELMDQIHSLRDLGVTVLLIEHKLQVVNTISDRVVVLDYGEKIAQGTAQEIQANPAVIEAYLGRQRQRA